MCLKCPTTEPNYNRSRLCYEHYRIQVKDWRLKNKDTYKRINRRAQLWSKYRIREEDYTKILEKQNSCCAICGLRKKLVVDHCHKTKVVRGLLCYNCNTLLGHIENKQKMDIVYDYLNRCRDGLPIGSVRPLDLSREPDVLEIKK